METPVPINLVDPTGSDILGIGKFVNRSGKKILLTAAVGGSAVATAAGCASAVTVVGAAGCAGAGTAFVAASAAAAKDYSKK